MNDGQSRLCGLDEAGRGAWAGPLVAAAVILHCASSRIEHLAHIKLKDGKLLDSKERETLYQALKDVHAEICIESISTRSINNHGIGWANKEIFKRLVKKIEADMYIIDGNLKIKFRGKTAKIKSVVDADATIPSVIFAGIAAKVERDRLMKTLHQQFPVYKWLKNAGYGTREHKDALLKYNRTYLHRNVFVTTGMRDKWY